MPSSKTSDKHEGHLAAIARRILELYPQRLPDLNSLHVLVPNPATANSLRYTLTQQADHKGYPSLFGPWIGTLRDWVGQHIPPAPDLTLINQQARKLLLFEAIKNHPTLFRRENLWQTCDSLLGLFDELSQYCLDNISSDDDKWYATVMNAWGNPVQDFEHLEHEASLVYTLWHAWQDEINANSRIDSIQLYIQRLHNLDAMCLYAQKDSGWHFCLLNDKRHNPHESSWLASLEELKRLDTIDITEPGNTSTISFLDAVFDDSGPSLLQRAQAFGKKKQSPLTLHICRPADGEQEARAIDLQVRKWLLAGKQKIGIVTEDRRLTRRVRALLERAGINAQDTGGWSLTTTSAAAVVERWLECVELDFNYRPLLDLLKSHFFIDEAQRESHLEAVYRFEHDIVLHEKISNNLGRYRAHMAYRKKRLQKNWQNQSYELIISLIDKLDTASQPLVQLFKSKTMLEAKTCLDTLRNSLVETGIEQQLQNDPAGICVLQVLDDMSSAATVTSPEFTWNDFRHWLARSLEEQYFKPHNTPSCVQLLNLEQSYLVDFDAVIIAAADTTHLPAVSRLAPVFNEDVRQALGLPNREQRHREQFDYYLSLVSGREECLVSCRMEDDGNPVELSPWVESIKLFHELTFDQSLIDNSLVALLDAGAGPVCDKSSEQPGMPGQPHPASVTSLIPDTLSASKHQRLVDCPYRFFAGDILGLKPPEEISEELQKSDYGERVHRILHAFHKQCDGLPAPFNETVTLKNRDQAITAIQELSATVFKKDLEDNIVHSGWMKRWQKRIPLYIDWLIERQQLWQPYQFEEAITTSLNNQLNITGRLDRIDQMDGHYAIVDYKTGKVAKAEEIASGEDVQLATYANLMDNVERVEYLGLDDKKKVHASGLEGDALQEIRTAVKERLSSMLTRIHDGEGLPANGEDKICRYCEFTGLCRKPVWEDEHN